MATRLKVQRVRVEVDSGMGNRDTTQTCRWQSIEESPKAGRRMGCLEDVGEKTLDIGV
jgi:hypothetical protein